MIRHSICDICTPGPHCGIDLTVEDGRITAVAGTPGFPGTNGQLCVKGMATADYVYRKDRIQTPLRRVGARGSDDFEPVSWEEALDLTANAFAKAKAETGAESVLFITGYEKWLRPWLQRFAFQFGSPNYLTESSTCNRSKIFAFKSMLGVSMHPDLNNASSCIGWGWNPYTNKVGAYTGLRKFKERGGKLLIVDPRFSETAEKQADLYLQPKNGTDIALAFAIARELFEGGHTDDTFLAQYARPEDVAALRACVAPFTPEYAEEVTGVPAEKICQAAPFFYAYGPATLFGGNGLTHRRSGFDLYRSIILLMILTGNIDKNGTMLPEQTTIAHSNGGAASREEEFMLAKRFYTLPPAVGAARFPFRNELEQEGQAMDLTRRIESGGDYPVKAALCLGVNHMMYPESDRMLRAMDRLDFIAASDLFWTETCRHADIVFPALSSVERSEVKCFAGKFITYTTPAIAPVTDGKDDVEILKELALRLLPDDELLCGGYDTSIRWILEPLGITDWDAVKAADLPVPVPNAKPYRPGSYLEQIPTPSGKIELCSSLAEKYADIGLTGFPVFTPPAKDADYPFTAMCGARLPFALHSRCHKVEKLRKLRPEPLVDISPADAQALGIQDGDAVRISTRAGSIVMKAQRSERILPGEISLYHGYEEANSNNILPIDELDPYSGFPAYKQMACRIEKAD